MLSWEYPPVVEGGLARHVRKVAEGLVARGVELHVLTRGARGGVEDRRGVVVHRVPEPAFPRDDLDAFLAWVERMDADMVEAADGLAFDLVHSHDWLVADAGERLARGAGVPWVVTVHATEHGRHQGWVDKHPQSHIHAVERGMVARADRVVACSRSMRAEVIGALGAPPRRVKVIPNAIDPADLHHAPPDELRALRARYAAPGEKLVLLAGRLVYEKGFQVALDALARVVARVDGVRFLVAGTGTHEAELRAQAERLGLLRHGAFAGWLGDDALHGLYRVSDLCVIPSLYEPFGLVALEAMASGCPCVVANTGGLREVVPRDVGLRVPRADPGELARVLERVLVDAALRERLAADGRRHVLRFDWGAVARRTEALYASALGAAARSVG
jgi:glycogen(starch) synthase